MQMKDTVPVPTTDPQRIVGPRIDQASQAIFIAAVAFGASVLCVAEPMVGTMLTPLAGVTPALRSTQFLFFPPSPSPAHPYVHSLSAL